MSDSDCTVVVVLQSEQVEWYKRHPDRLVSNLVQRINSGETDPWPGYARWNGGGCSGMQVVWNEPNDKVGILAVGSGHGQKIAFLKNKKNNKKDKKLQLSILKMLARRLGYRVVPKNE